MKVSSEQVPEHPNADLVARVKESATQFLQIVKKKFEISLDYSEASLYAVDTLLSLFFKERRPFDLVVTFVGSYLGEVLIHNLGGKWEPRGLSVVKIGRQKGTSYPFRQARKRLEKGLGEALTSWYARIKMDYCQDGELCWNGMVSQELSKVLLAQDWDSRLLRRILHSDERQYVREEAAHLLTRLKSERVAPALVEWLNYPERAYYACIALQGIHEPDALPMLRKWASDLSDMAVRLQAIQALGEHKDSESIPVLFGMLNDPDEVVCHYASQALAKIAGEQVLKGLIDILGGQRIGNKVFAISSLELIGDRACVPYLVDHLFSEKESIREAATRALQYLPDARALSPLIILLDDGSSRIRILAAYALTFIGDPVALEPLRRLLKDSVKEVRDHVGYLIPLLESGERPPGFCW